MEAAALARGPLLMHSWTEGRRDDGDLTSTSELLPPVFVVGVGPAEARYRVDFPQARAIEALLWQRLCNALPEQEDWSPDVLIQLPDDP